MISSGLAQLRLSAIQASRAIATAAALLLSRERYRVESANNLHGDLFISVRSQFELPDNLRENWQYEGKKHSYSDRFSGYAIFVSNDNADRADSLAFGHLLGQELQKRGLRYTPHYSVGIQNYVFMLPLTMLERERKIRLNPSRPALSGF